MDIEQNGINRQTPSRSTDPLDNVPTLRWTAGRGRPQRPEGEGNVAEGELIINRYRITSELGHGSMGVVYACHDEVGDVDVALKAVASDLAHNPAVMAAVQKTYRLASSLSHPNIAQHRTIELNPDTGASYLIMEHVQGVSLLQWRQKAEGRSITPKEVIPLLQQAAAALDYAHQRGMVHCDIKPANIMVSTDGIVKILDFGVVSAVTATAGPNWATAETSPCLQRYTAPERLRGLPAMPASDQYALGVVTWELLTGRPFVPGSDLATAAPSGLNWYQLRAIQRGVANDPAQRFPSCMELVRALEHGLDLQADTNAAANEGLPTGQQDRWRLAFSLLLILEILFALAMAAAWIGLSRGAPRAADMGTTESPLFSPGTVLGLIGFFWLLTTVALAVAGFKSWRLRR